MRRAISRKLRDQRGASLLLALLFLLICSMVAASILMAAAANAGKHRSNLEEHQVYLALSSAVSTLCDELNRSEYRGQYNYWVTEHTDLETLVTTYSYHLEQMNGTYRHAETDQNGYLKDILLADFDLLFAEEINRALAGTEIINENPKSGTIIAHTLTLTPNTSTELDDTPVHITLEVKDSYAIYIAAYLDELEVYKVEAELTPNESKPTLSMPLTEGVQDTQPMKWKLGWITIADEEEGGATEP